MAEKAGKPDSTDRYNFVERVRKFRADHKDILMSHYIDILPTLIGYLNLPDSLDGLDIEQRLRIRGKSLIIGEDVGGKIVLLGEAINIYSNPFGFPVVKGIRFYIPKKQRAKRYIQMTPRKRGNFFLLTNKHWRQMWMTSDFQVIDAYTTHLAEIKTRRYQLTFQSGAITYFKGETEGNSLNQLISDFYDGAPSLKIKTNFDINKSVGQIAGANVIPNLLTGNKDEYNNILSEMLTMIGVNNLGVQKESGVSSKEANANNGLVIAGVNTFIQARQEGFNLLNKYYKTNVLVHYNNSMGVADQPNAGLDYSASGYEGLTNSGVASTQKITRPARTAPPVGGVK